MNPFDEKRCEPNYWLSALIIDKDAMCKQVRSGTEAIYIPEKGKELSDRDTGSNLKYQCRRKTDLETDAYAANVQNE